MRECGYSDVAVGGGPDRRPHHTNLVVLLCNYGPFPATWPASCEVAEPSHSARKVSLTRKVAFILSLTCVARTARSRSIYEELSSALMAAGGWIPFECSRFGSTAPDFVIGNQFAMRIPPEDPPLRPMRRSPRQSQTTDWPMTGESIGPTPNWSERRGKKKARFSENRRFPGR